MTTITTTNLILSTPSLDDLTAIIDFQIRNKDHLKKWETVNFEDPKSLKASLKKQLRAWIKECKDKKSVRFSIKVKENPTKIIGFCNFTQIFYGSFQACYLGYKIDYEYEGKGLMFEALRAAITYVFEDIGLHRIMANYIPVNIRSVNLLKRLGFNREGFAKNYLLINDKWEDHVLTALSKEEWQFIQKVNNDVDKKEQHEILFREIQPNDAVALIPLMDKLGYPLNPILMRENIQKYIFSNHQKAWIAETHGQIIGCIVVALTDYFHRPGSFLRVIILVVDAHPFRAKIAKHLLNIVEDFALKNSCSHIEFMNGVDKAEVNAHTFYQSLGYTELNSTKVYFAKKL